MHLIPLPALRVLAGQLSSTVRQYALHEQAAQEGIELEVIKLDILSEIDRQSAYKYNIDILVNNAGIGETGPIAKFSLAC